MTMFLQMKNFAIVAVLIATVGAAVRQKRGIPDVWPPNDPDFIWVKDVDLGGEVNVDCRTFSVDMNVSASYIEEQGLGLVDHVVLVDENGEPFENEMCQTDDIEDGYYKLELYGKLGLCSKNIEVVNTDIYVHYSMCFVPEQGEGVISRHNSVTVDVQCVYDSDVITSIDLEPLPRARYVSVGANTGMFSVRMRRYQASAFIATTNKRTALVGNPIYIGVSLESADETDLIMRNSICWVSSASEGTEPLANDYIVTTDGCSNSEEEQHENDVVFYNTGRLFDFSFGAYYQTLAPRTPMYVHCIMDVCSRDGHGEECEVQVCDAKRKKRSFSETAKSANTRHVTFGPLEISEPNKCRQVDHGCSHACAVNSPDRLICTCPTGLVLDIDDKTCIGYEQLVDNTEEHILNIEAIQEHTQVLSQSLIYLMIGNVALLVILLCLCGYLQKQKKEGQAVQM